MSFSENPDYGFIRAGWTRVVAPGDPDPGWPDWLCPGCFELYQQQFGWIVEEQA
jgi:hypothetical protein